MGGGRGRPAGGAAAGGPRAAGARRCSRGGAAAEAVPEAEALTRRAPAARGGLAAAGARALRQRPAGRRARRAAPGARTRWPTSSASTPGRPWWSWRPTCWPSASTCRRRRPRPGRRPPRHPAAPDARAAPHPRRAPTSRSSAGSRAERAARRRPDGARRPRRPGRAGRRRPRRRQVRRCSTSSAASCVAEGWRVAVGRCPEADGAPPAWAWVEALRALAADVDPGPQAAAARAAARRRRLQRRGSGDSDAAFGRFRLHRAVVGCWPRRATDRPLAVVLDDLHRADEETLALLGERRGRRSPGSRCCWSPPTGRPRSASGWRRRFAALARARADPAARWAAWTPAQAAPAGPGRRRRPARPAHPRARSPSAPAATPSTSARAPGCWPARATWSRRPEVPEGVRDVLRRRFARLPEVTVAVLRLAAVIGRDVDIDVLVARRRGRRGDRARRAGGRRARRACSPSPAPGAVRFTHALVRETLYGDLSRLRRGRWHAPGGRRARAGPAGRPRGARPPLHAGRRRPRPPGARSTPRSRRPRRPRPATRTTPRARSTGRRSADLDRVPPDPRRRRRRRR